MRRTIALALGLWLWGAVAGFAAWETEALAEADTIELYTVNEEGEGHWSPVWIVVVEGEPYVRLGNRAARRIESNATGSILRVRLSGEEVHSVRVVPEPETADAVAAAMAEKYWSDLLIRFFSHPLTLRLEREDGGRKG